VVTNRRSRFGFVTDSMVQGLRMGPEGGDFAPTAAARLGSVT
jgi:hypothetical protein